MWKKINLSMALPDFGKEEQMAADLENMFGVNQENTGAARVAKYAFQVNKVFDADSRAHLIVHLEDKMKDPESSGCSDPIRFVMFVLFEQFNHEEMLLLIEAIRPEQQDLGQSFGAVIEAIMRSMMEQRKRRDN